MLRCLEQISLQSQKKSLHHEDAVDYLRSEELQGLLIYASKCKLEAYTHQGNTTNKGYKDNVSESGHLAIQRTFGQHSSYEIGTKVCISSRHE